MDWNFVYGELERCGNFVSQCETLKEDLTRMEELIDYLVPMKKPEAYDHLEPADRIELDLLLAYTFCALQWIYLRVNGIDPTTHPIKGNLDKLKKAMIRWKEVKDKENRPIVNVAAAKRFIRSGLYDPNSHGESSSSNKKPQGPKTDE